MAELELQAPSEAWQGLPYLGKEIEFLPRNLPHLPAEPLPSETSLSVIQTNTFVLHSESGQRVISQPWLIVRETLGPASMLLAALLTPLLRLVLDCLTPTCHQLHLSVPAKEAARPRGGTCPWEGAEAGPSTPTPPASPRS